MKEIIQSTDWSTFNATYPDRIEIFSFGFNENSVAKLVYKKSYIVRYDEWTGSIVPGIYFTEFNKVPGKVLMKFNIKYRKENDDKLTENIIRFYKDGRKIYQTTRRRTICTACANNMACHLGESIEFKRYKNSKTEIKKSSKSCENFFFNKSILTKGKKKIDTLNPESGGFIPRLLEYYSLIPINKIFAYSSMMLDSKDANFIGKVMVIPKRNKGKRIIVAPSAAMKKILSVMHTKILLPIEDKQDDRYRDIVTAFRQGTGIKDNAEKHIKKDVLLSIDLKNFFHSIDYKMIKNYLLPYYSKGGAHICANLMSYPFGRELFKRHSGSVFNGRRKCAAQGWPTSPIISNLIAYKDLDVPLTHSVLNNLDNTKIKNMSYTRYADDLTLSFDFIDGIIDNDFIDKVINSIHSFVNTQTPFKVNKKKIKKMVKTNRQYCCGVIVNDKANISKQRYKKDRAMIDYYHKGRLPFSMYSKLMGHVSFGMSLAPSKYIKLKEKLISAKQIRSTVYEERI